MNRDQRKDIALKMAGSCYKQIFKYIHQGDEETARRLIEHHIEENKWESEEVYGCLLAIASQNGEIKIAEFLKDQGVNLDREVFYGKTPLQITREYGRKEMAELLKEWGAKKGWDSPENIYTYVPPSDWKKSSYEKEEIRDKLALYWKQIFSCIREGNKKDAEEIIGDFISRNKYESEEVYGSLLVIAATEGEIQVAEFCKDHGADLDYVSCNGRTPLWLSRENGKNKMVETLEKWGARGDTDEYYGKPSSDLTKPSDRDKIKNFYHGAFSRCFKEGLNKENLAKTVEDFAQNKGYCIKEVYGELLLCSVAGREVNIAKFCKDNGADLNYKGYSGKTPLKVAKEVKYSEMIEFLRECGKQIKTSCLSPV